MWENVGVLLAWDQFANASSLQTHAQIKTPFREDPTLVTEVFQTWFPVLSYAFIMTHFAASSLRLLGCGDEAFRRKHRTREKQTWHPSQVRLWVVLILTYRQTSEMVGRKMKPLIALSTRL